MPGRKTYTEEGPKGLQPMETNSARIVPSSSRRTFRGSPRRGACSTTLLVVLLGGGALAVGLFSNHAYAIGLGLTALGLFLLIGTGLLPHILADRLQRPFSVIHPAQATFGHSVCVILLGEGSTTDPRTQERVPSWIAGSRIATAAGLHRAAVASGAKCWIIIAGERTRSEISVSPSAYARMLTDLGVAESDVIFENDGLNTYQHARNISVLVKLRPAETTYLVTSALHMKRALLYLGAFGLRPSPFPSDFIHAPRQMLPVGYNFAVSDIALHQHIGILRFHLYEALGINRRSVETRSTSPTR
ncbi:MAG TPA: YdcF family protein [Opitutaceae bacterium]|nr:YdcF family protein [Opitutaceae bacterium]